jgi:hypothetical protein
VREGAASKDSPLFESRPTRRDRSDNVGVVGGINDDSDVVVVFGGRANHGWATNVDVFDHGCGVRTARNGGGEGVQVDDNQIE